MTDIKLDLLQTLSLAALVYFGGIQLKKRVRWLDRLNIPAAVVGGLYAELLEHYLVFHRGDTKHELAKMSFAAPRSTAAAAPSRGAPSPPG